MYRSTAAGVRKDIDNLMRVSSLLSIHVVMHDSMNPVVRRGLRSANWPDSPYVHRVELDFVPGGVSARPELHGQLWNGLALAVLKPTPRIGELKIAASSQMTFQAADRAFSPGLIRKALDRLARIQAEKSAHKLGWRDGERGPWSFLASPEGRNAIRGSHAHRVRRRS